jgi:uncharacterized protein involved in exopolysaccharide biosynthesis
MASGVWAANGEARASAPARVRLRYSPEDFATLLWRQRWLMLGVFLVILLIGLAVALRLKTSYSASSSLLVRLGQEYVYSPEVGDAARGAAPDNDQIVQSEVEILNSAALKERVIVDIGLAKIFPDLGRDYAHADAEKKRMIEGAAIKGIESGMKVATAPGAAVVRLSYSHPNPQVAALVLNTLIDEYLVYRRSVLLDRDVKPLEEQRKLFEVRLAAADNELTAYLAKSGIGDFEAEKLALAGLYGQLLADSYSTLALAGETRSRLGVVSVQAAGAPNEIGLYRDIDHTAADKLAALKVELNDLLARYQPTSQPVRDKQGQVAAMERLVSQQRDVTSGARLGVNPVAQALQTERNTLTAQAASLTGRRAAIAAELQRVTARRQMLAALEPRYQELVRQRDVLAVNARNFAARSQENQAAQALASRSDDNIRVVQRAYVPTRGVSLKKPALIVSALFAGFAAVCAGLIGAFLSRGYPSARAAERTLDLPVLSTIPRKARA